MVQDIEQILFNNTLINMLIHFLPYYLVLTYVRKQPHRKMALCAVSAVAIVVCISFPITVWSGFRFDLRHIGFIFGSLYGGPAVTLLLLAILSAYRFALGGIGMFYGIGTCVVMSFVLILIRPAYLHAATKGKVQHIAALSAGYVVFLLLSLKPFRFSQLHWWYSLEYIFVAVGTTLITLYIFLRAEHQSALESQLETSERLKAVSQIAASVSHEIRNPLTVVSGFVQLMMKQEMSRDKQLQYFAFISEELKRSQLIINDYLALARGDEDCHDIRVDEELAYVANIITPLATMNQVEVRTRLESDAHLRVNRNKFRQSILNVTKNAIEAMPGGGTLKLRSYVYKDKLAIVVDDNGVGMTRDQLGKIGTPFFSNKTTGTGLGMLIVNNMLKLTGGKMKVTSEPGKGTTFAFEFPLRADQPPASHGQIR